MNNTYNLYIPNLGYGGSETWTINIVNALEKEKKKVNLFCLASLKKDRIESLSKNINVKITNRSNYFLTLIKFYKIIKSRKKNSSNIFLTQRVIFAYALLDIIFNFNLDKVIFRFSVHNTFLKKHKVKDYNKLFNFFLNQIFLIYFQLKKPNVIFQSHDQFLDFNKNQKYIKYSNNLVIPNPVTIKDLNNHSNKEFNFISVSRLSFEKDLIFSIKIFEFLPDNFTLTIYGDGPLFDEINSQIIKKKLSKKIKILNPVKTVPYKNFNYYLFNSIFDTMPNSVIESISYGIPVLARKCPGGISELIKDGINGKLVNSDISPKLFSQIIKENVKKNWNTKDVSRTIANGNVNKIIKKIISI